jgi:protease I
MNENKPLTGTKVAILVADGFEQVEMTQPRQALHEAGARTEIVSPEKDALVRGWKHIDWGDPFPIDLSLVEADAHAFDALLLPGGVLNPDRLRIHDLALEFVRAFARGGKPIAAICHAPWTLISAGLVKGRRLTSWPSVRLDLENAGAQWVDEEAVVDGSLITSRKPGDIPAFNRRMIEVFAATRQLAGTRA